MKQRPRPAISLGIAALLGLASACGYTDEGEGSGTLDAQITALYRFGDALEISATLRDGSGANVTGAAIKVIAEEGPSVTLEDQGGGDYEGSLESYHRRIRLSIDAGSQGNLSAALEGPGPFTLAEPLNNDLLNYNNGQEVDVRWITDDGLRADEVALDFGRQELTSTEDKGKITVRLAQVGNGHTQVEVTRRNVVSLAGGISGSRLRLGYYVSNEVEVSGVP